jgi:hypothetical protein
MYYHTKLILAAIQNINIEHITHETFKNINKSGDDFGSYLDALYHRDFTFRKLFRNQCYALENSLIGYSTNNHDMDIQNMNDLIDATMNISFVL